MDEAPSRKAPPVPRLPRLPRLRSSPGLPGALPETLTAGTRLGRYELAARVRDDEAGSLWLAHEEMPAGAERIVGLRIAAPGLAADQLFRELLRQEVKLAGGVAHPNVAQVLELGKEAGTLFVASEWVEGDTLAELRTATSGEPTAIPAAIILRILADACAGLHAAHLLRDRKGELLNVVHGDVSPASIQLAIDGTVRIVDLGFMKARARHGGGANLAWSQSGRAPGHRIDRHADVWGIGAILAEALEDAGEWDADAGAGAPVLSELVLRARSIDPVERFATAAEMQGAIEAAMMTLGLGATHATVAAFLKEKLGDRAAVRAALVWSARARKPRVLSVPTPAVESVRATVRSVRPEPGHFIVSSPGFGDTGNGISRTPIHGTPAPGRSGAGLRRSTGLLFGGLALAAVGLGATRYFLARGSSAGTARATGVAPSSEVAAGDGAPSPAVPVVDVSSLPLAPIVTPPPGPTCPAGMVAVASANAGNEPPLAPFCLDAAPVTTEAYKACSDAGDCKRAAFENRWAGITSKERAAYDPLCRERDPKTHAREPVNCIDRAMAALYCKARGARLPTEPESAFATRGIDGKPRGASEGSASFSEWSLRPNEPASTRSYALGFRCARSL
jgi:hypothetical protein